MMMQSYIPQAAPPGGRSQALPVPLGDNIRGINRMDLGQQPPAALQQPLMQRPGSTTPFGGTYDLMRPQQTDFTPFINMLQGFGQQQQQAQQQFQNAAAQTPYAPGQGSPADWLASLGPNNQFLTNFAQNGRPVQLQNPYLAGMAETGLPGSIQGGYLENWANNGRPVDALPAWQTYVDAMQRNVDRGSAGLMEMFNQAGGYTSTSFGNAAVDYQGQVNKDQNALLAQMGYQSLSDATNRQYQAGSSFDTLQAQLQEAARGRQLQAGSTLDQLQFQGLSDATMREYGASQALGQQAFQGASQLAGYDFQSQMAQYQASLQAAMMAAQSAGAGQLGAMSQLGQYGNAASNQLLNNSLFGTSNLFGGSQSALNNLFGSSNNALTQLLQGQLGYTGQGVQGYSNLAGNYLQNLGLGGQMGQQQYGNLQSQLGSLYQEWLRTQPQYNPTLPYQFQGATGYIPTSQTTSPGFWDYFSQILGGGISAAGSIIGGGLAGGLFSDERLKENIVPIGRLHDVNLYEYNFKGLPGKQVGVLAQEVVTTHPTAVIPGDDAMPWRVDYKQLINELMLTGRVN